MVLSKREKLIVYALGAVVGVMALDWVLVEPLLAARAEAQARVASLTSETERVQGVFENSKRARRRLTEMVRGQLPTSASEAESRMLNGVRDWAQDAGLAVSSLKSDRAEKEKDFSKMTFRATGTGNLNQVARFLYAVQTAPIAVRVTDLKLSARKEGTDDLSIDVSLATVHQAQAAGGAALAGVRVTGGTTRGVEP